MAVAPLAMDSTVEVNETPSNNQKRSPSMTHSAENPAIMISYNITEMAVST